MISSLKFLNSPSNEGQSKQETNRSATKQNLCYHAGHSLPENELFFLRQDAKTRNMALARVVRTFGFARSTENLATRCIECFGDLNSEHQNTQLLLKALQKCNLCGLQ